MNRKIALGIGSLALVIVPFATLVSCGKSQKADSSKIITIELGEAQWKGHFESVVAAYKKAHPESKFTFKIKQVESKKKLLAGSKLTDPGVADIFMVPANEMGSLTSNKFIMPIVKDLAKFAKSIGGPNGVTFIKKAITVMNKTKTSNGYFGIAENVEGILYGTVTKGKVPQKSTIIAPLSNLYMIAGYLNNSAAGNFTKSLSTDPTTGKLTQHLANYQDVIKNFYTNIVAPMKTLADKKGGLDVFSKDGAVSGKEIHKLLHKLYGMNNFSYKIPIGSWEINDYKKDIGKTGAKLSIGEAPETYRQWGNSWEYVVNARNKGNPERIKAIKQLIQEFLNPTHAKSMFNNWSKMMPTIEGTDPAIVGFKKEDNPAEFGELKAIRGDHTIFLPRPGSTFDGVWGGGWAIPFTNTLNNVKITPSAQALYDNVLLGFKGVVRDANI